MKLYEEILFKSYSEKINFAIKLIIFTSYIATEIYYFITSTITPFFICMVGYPLWDFIFQRNTIIIGDKNIIIGRNLFPCDLVQSISIDEKRILIKADGQSFKIKSWAIRNQKNKLELVIKKITDKTED